MKTNEQVGPANRRTRSDLLWLTAAFVLPLLWLAVLRILAIPVGESTQDAYYHASMALRGPEAYLGRTFPWMELSIWKDAFADKELAYHALLDGIFRLQRLFGAEVEPPFHFAAFCFLAFMTGGFLFAGTRLKIRPVLLFAGSLLAVMMSPNYLYRIEMLRPHVLSIGAMTYMVGILALPSPRMRLLFCGLLSFFFAWSYSNPHFIALAPLAFAACRTWKDGWRPWLCPALSIACVMLGLVAHPQFPNSFLIWKAQSWDALIAPMQRDVLLSKPTEMMSPAFLWQLYALPTYFVACALLFGVVGLTERVGFRRVGADLYALLLLSFLFTLGIFVALRAIEYATPFLALAAALLAERSLLCAPRQETIRKRRIVWASALSALGIGLGVYSSAVFLRDCPKMLFHATRNMNEWFRTHLPKGASVVNLDWSDFPILFYSNPDIRWQWGMDPVFAYLKEPEKTRLLTRVYPDPRYGGVPEPQEVAAATGATYGVLAWPRSQQARYLFESGWKLEAAWVNEKGKEEGWIFRLDGKRK